MDRINSNQQLIQMIENYKNLIFSICLKMTNDYFAAEDLTQETFLSAFRALDQFDGANEKAWLCRIATNKCLDYQKQAARRLMPSEDSELAQYQSNVGLPESDYIEKEAYERLKEACKQLKPPYDKISYLYFVEEQKAEEIALITHKNIKTIQTQIYRARAMLRKQYGRE